MTEETATPERPSPWLQALCLVVAFVLGYLADGAAGSYDLAGWPRTIIVLAVVCVGFIGAGFVADTMRAKRG